MVRFVQNSQESTCRQSREWDTQCVPSRQGESLRCRSCRSRPRCDKPGDSRCLFVGTDARGVREYHSAWSRESLVSEKSLDTKCNPRNWSSWRMRRWIPGAASTLWNRKFGRCAATDSRGSPRHGISACRAGKWTNRYAALCQRGCNSRPEFPWDFS